MIEIGDYVRRCARSLRPATQRRHWRALVSASLWMWAAILDVHTSSWAADCNRNAVDDSEDIAGGTSADCNENAVPDECDLADPEIDLLATREVDYRGSQITTADFDEDGATDFLTLGNGVVLEVLLARGANTYEIVSVPAGSPEPHWLIGAADLVGSSAVDIVSGGSDGLRIREGNGDGSFGDVTDVFISTNSLETSFFDVDANGRLDIVAAAHGAFQVVLILSFEGGDFSNRLVVPLPFRLSDVAVADLNEDGLGDVVAVSSVDGLAVVLSTETGEFVDGPRLGAGNSPEAVSTGDLDRDGHIDVVTSDHPFDAVSVFLGNGDGSLEARQSYGAGIRGNRTVHLEDIDGDGALDVAGVTDQRRAFVLWGDGLGGFGDPTFLPRGDFIDHLLLGDFDGSGAVDIGGARAGSASLFLNRSSRQFTVQSTLSPGFGLQHAATADLNGDRIEDIAAVSDQDQQRRVVLWLSDGPRSYVEQAPIALDGTPNAVAFGDFDEDGEEDLVATSRTTEELIEVRRGLGGALFEDPTVIRPEFSVGAVQVDDVDGDDHLDLITDNSGRFSIYYGHGDGTFTPPTVVRVLDSANGLQVADVDGDGEKDIVTRSSVHRGQGNRTFEPAERLPFEHATRHAGVGDFNGDGVVDVVVTAAEGVRVALGDGAGRFVAQEIREWAFESTAVVVSDLDGDGFDDVVATDFEGRGELGAFLTFRSSGDGTLEAPSVHGVGIRPAHVTGSDLDGDGRTDFVTSNVRDLSIVYAETRRRTEEDCDENSVPDSCELSAATDRNDNGTLDACEIDCNENGVPDDVDLARGDAEDLNGNGVPDACEEDCNLNGLSDSAEISRGAPDCNRNGVLDECEIVTQGDDCNENGVPDECDVVPVSELPLHTDVSAGQDLWRMTAGDFDGDGDVDLAVLDSVGDRISLLFNRGNATFPAPTRIPVAAAQEIRTADVNGDDHLDLVIVCTEDDRFLVLLGDGAGSFSEGSSRRAGTTPLTLEVADLDDNGTLDVLVSDITERRLIAFLGDGTGSFGNAVNSDVERRAVDLAVADFDGDGIPDVALADSDGRSVSVCRGLGSGRFGSPRDLPGKYAQPVAVEAMDGNADGRIDLVVASQVTGDRGRVIYAENDGSAQFEQKKTFFLEGVFQRLALEDIDDDGFPEAFVLDSDGAVSFLGGTKAPNVFVPAVSLAIGNSTVDLAISDLDGDGLADLAISQGVTGLVRVIRGVDASVPFAAALRESGFNEPTEIAVADFDRDGRDDFVVASRGTRISVATLSDTERLRIVRTLESEPSGDLRAVVTGDIDKDGQPDIVAGGRSGALHVFYGEGGFRFTRSPQVGMVAAYGLALGDLDADGHLDLLAANEPAAAIWVLMGAGDGTFVPPRSVPAGMPAFRVTVADVDDDGVMDAVLGSDSRSFVSVLPGLGNGEFGEARLLATSGNTGRVEVVDLNEDSVADILAATSTGVSVLFGRGGGEFETFQSFSTGFGTVDIEVIDFDGDDHLDVVAGGTAEVALLTGMGDGNLERRTTIATGELTLAVAAPRLNFDDTPDIVSASLRLDSVSILLSDSQPATSFDVNENFVPDECEGGRQKPGDCNQDGQVDIGDGICLLGFLFLGSPTQLPCDVDGRVSPGSRALLDVQNDGEINLTDAVSILSFLFLGGPPHWLMGDDPSACVALLDCPDVSSCP